MKVVHILWGVTFGGIETMLVNIANAQAAEGAEVSVIIINDLYDESLMRLFMNKINLISLHRKQRSRSLGFIIKLNWMLCRINPDTIHLHGSRLYGMIFSRRLSRKACVTLHDLPAGSVRREGFFSRIFPILSIMDKTGNVTFIDKVPKVFAISEAVKKALWKNYGVSSVVVCNGICTKNFAKRELVPCSSPLRIVQVSRLEHGKKGQDMLIQAISQLNGMAEVYFIGEGSSLEYLKKLANEVGAENYVHFLGKQTQDYIANHLHEYDLFVQPSRYEGFGLTVAEAMAAQVPVLVSTGQGPAEVTCEDKYGWLFENGDVKDLIRMIGHIREHFFDALTKARKARRYVTDTYDVSVTAKKYLEEYERFKM